ncbi:4-oxalocrotonate tautomerase [Pseudoalteromonas piscicida]|uniref:Tautomerase n=1 Tax=Pseudoalteromonas piscicida TaxID=43662 RepID=A0AAQ2IQZ4_PSEO7|nr:MULTISPECIES: 4-oxalocrotonate tautomerase family protein [Pseudoalteromonas]KJY90013.1 4-oxalocrotonate tautomerase [Pseudoalteromonas piscicida]TMN35051.1 4-oxalocrotonate tautomerase [Pseudoalteromonas piscicida]TMN39252.1 4-oxalocrotonate tautomerase [Pseudoalteromonas piscicida]TMN52820.1 4-oxalocrotonate tautomerase [Pseudoalteromonas piscicida]TMN53980.1 4-oxalocrotonate tautomerase [Pseudoalteromonas piscicida]
MPIINIKITKEGVTPAQKQALIKGATQLMVDVLDKAPQVTFVVIEEVETDDWGIGFDQVSMLRQQHLSPK